MAGLSKIDKTVRLPVAIAVFPYLQDHRFEGKAVLPAVESMRVLASAVKEFAPETDISAVENITFDKFLFIPTAAKKIEALCNITQLVNGGIRAVLQTKTRTKTAAFTRIKDHVTVHYPAEKPVVTSYFHNRLRFGHSDSGCLKISADQIYRELVPFGPAYHNISENLSVYKDGAVAKLRAPEHLKNNTGQLGSPFVLDAAFHCACVWGQRYRGMVAFPVAIEKRIIFEPTRSGDTYIGTVSPVRIDSNMLIFDIYICDEDNTLYEIALGVHMRDVSAGRMRPPSWIITTEEKI
ncbi:MAG: polyketide synthase dehydratase domain-containing protein [Desulfobacterales bacterium]|jgi:hypothetical protein